MGRRADGGGGGAATCSDEVSDRAAGAVRQRGARGDAPAFFSSSESSFQSFFWSSSRCLNVCSCSAGVSVFHDASICAPEAFPRDVHGAFRVVRSAVHASRREGGAGEGGASRGVGGWPGGFEGETGSTGGHPGAGGMQRVDRVVVRSEWVSLCT